MAGIVANYANDFPDQSGILTPGWQYQWNSPVDGISGSGSISDAETVFVPMVYTGSQTSWTPDGDLIPTNDPNSAYVRLSAQGGHPGVSDNQLANGVARYSIASYTVGESGFYAIDDSFIGLDPVHAAAKSDGVEYRVFVNRDSVVTSGVVVQGARDYFDTSLGFLRAGDTIHVAFGSVGNQSYDYFTTDFSVIRDVELEQVAGSFREDFPSAELPPESQSQSQPVTGWNYYWNAPANWGVNQAQIIQESGRIGDPNSYLPLANAGQGHWTADGDLDGTNSEPDFHLRLSETGGQVGGGFLTPDYHDRFAIASYTVEHSGLHAITNSFLSVADNSDDGVEIYIHVGDGPRLTGQPLIVLGGDTAAFDMSLGFLKKGDTVYVGYGAHGNHIHDRFQTDFSIVRSLPRAAPDLGLLDHAGVIVSVNDSHFGAPGAIPDDNLDDWEAFANALAYADTNGANEVHLDHGTYNLSSAGINEAFAPLFKLTQYRDLVFNGNGSTLIVDDYTRPLFHAHDSTNVIFKDLIVDYAERVPAQGNESSDLYKPLTFTQGVISNLNKANNTFILTVNTDAFVAPDATFQRGNSQGWGYVLDRNVDGRLKVGSDWHYPTLAVEAGARQNQFTVSVPTTQGLANGDRYILQRRQNAAMFGFYNRSSDISLVNVTVYSAPSVFVSSVHSDSINIINSHASIRPDDWPGTPDTQRWKSINADGVHIQSNRTGVWVEDSTFEGVSDDVMNFYTLPLTVYEQLSDIEFTLGSILYDDLRGIPSEAMMVGDHLTFFDPVEGRVIKKVQVIAVRETTIADPNDPLGNPLRLKTVTIDQPVAGVLEGSDSDEAGFRNETTVFNLDLSRSSLVQDSKLQNSRRYGNYLLSSNVQLIDNFYEGLSNEAIAAHNEPGWPLGPFASDILVQGNEFINNGFSRPYLSTDYHAGTVAFHAARYVDPSAPGNNLGYPDFLVDESEYVYRDIEIRDNVFYHWRKSAISIRNAQSVTVADNSILAELPRNLVDKPSEPIQVHFTSNVAVDSNIVVDAAHAVDESNNNQFVKTRTQFVLNRDLEAWMKFDNAQFFKDSSNNGVVPYFNNAGVDFGRFDMAPVFNSTNSITLTGISDQATESRTISLWFDSAKPDWNREQVIYEEGDSKDGLNIYFENGELFLGAWSVDAFETFLHTSLQSHGWNHVALVLDGDHGRIRGYLNGRKFAIGALAAVLPQGDEINLGRVGAHGTRFESAETAVEGYGFAGKVDDVRIYGRALGDGEVSGLAGR